MGRKLPSSGRSIRLRSAEKPKAPAAMPSRKSARSCASSAAVTDVRSRAARAPSTQARSGEYGKSEATFTPSPCRSRLSRYSGKVIQSQRMPFTIES